MVKRYKRSEIRTMSKLVIREQDTKRVKNVIFPNGLQVGLGQGDFDKSLVVMGGITASGGVNAGALTIRDHQTDRSPNNKVLVNDAGVLKWGGTAVGTGTVNYDATLIEYIRDVVDSHVLGGTGIDVTVDDASDTHTLSIDLNELSSGTPDASSDDVVFIDDDDNGTKKGSFPGHDSLTGFVADEHVAHSTVSITAGNGLTGGGTIASTRTLSVDIHGATDGTGAGTLASNDEILWYDTTAGSVKRGTISQIPDTNTQLTTEEVQDIVGGMLGGTETRISVTYDDSAGNISFVVDDMTANTQLTTEEVQDIVGGMVTGNTETNIAVTYVDGGVGAGKLNFAATDTNTDTVNSDEMLTVQFSNGQSWYVAQDGNSLGGNGQTYGGDADAGGASFDPSGSGWGGGCLITCCFAGDTKIYTLDGYTDIENIRPGSYVWSWNFEGQYIEPARVNELVTIHQSNASKQALLIFEHGISLTATADHPFYVNGKGWSAIDYETWATRTDINIDVSQLEIGDVCFTWNNTTKKLEPCKLIEIFSVPRSHVYTLALDKNWCFFAESILAHQETPEDNKEEN